LGKRTTLVETRMLRTKKMRKKGVRIRFKRGKGQTWQLGESQAIYYEERKGDTGEGGENVSGGLGRGDSALD